MYCRLVVRWKKKDNVETLNSYQLKLQLQLCLLISTQRGCKLTAVCIHILVCMLMLPD
jgi:hypothetical protein